MEKHEEWKEATWARQVGRTVEMQEFGALYYKNTVYVNFETDEKIGKYLEADIHTNHIMMLGSKP